MEVKAVSSSWEDVTKAATELGKADLEKKRDLFGKLMKKRSDLYVNVAEVNADLKLQSLRIAKLERKFLSFKDKCSRSQSKVKNSKKRNEISDLLEKENQQSLKNKTYLTVLQKKLKRIETKMRKLKSCTVEELRLAKVNKKLGRRVRELESSAQSQSLNQKPPEPEENSATNSTSSTICPFEAPFHSLIEFLSNFISSKASSIECPVCYTVPSPPIYSCPNSHIICSTCLPRVSSKCPTCRTRLGPKQIHRHAEGSWKELDMIKTKVDEIHPLKKIT